MGDETQAATPGPQLNYAMTALTIEGFARDVRAAYEAANAARDAAERAYRRRQAELEQIAGLMNSADNLCSRLKRAAKQQAGQDGASTADDAGDEGPF